MIGRMLTGPIGLVVILWIALSLSCGEASDEERDYLREYCGVLDVFSDNLVEQQSAVSIADAMRALIRDLSSISPPTSLAEFHREFIDFVEESLEDPGSLVVGEAPKPPEPVRLKLSGAERGIDECVDAEPFKIAE